MNGEEITTKSSWFAIKTRHDFRAEEVLGAECEDIFFPKEYIKTPSGKWRSKAVIPHVVFIKTTTDKALQLERLGRQLPQSYLPFWIYRYPQSNDIQPIAQSSIDLLRLLTTDDTTRCRIYTPKEFTANQRVRVIDGVFKGYEGFVRRVEKNKHVIVEIEGICMVILPFIHPDLLQHI